MIVYIEVINLNGTTYFDICWVIIKCRLVLKCWIYTQYG
jgi:hypothetical protein